MALSQVIVKEPGGVPRMREVDVDDLAAMQKLVAGPGEAYPMIETYRWYDGTIPVFNENGKGLGLAPNIVLLGDTLVGTLFVVRDTKAGDFIGLSDRDQENTMRSLTLHAVENADDGDESMIRAQKDAV